MAQVCYTTCRQQSSREVRTVCEKCKDMPADYRTEAGHLTLDPVTGATILEPHDTNMDEATR